LEGATDVPAVTHDATDSERPAGRHGLVRLVLIAGCIAAAAAADLAGNKLPEPKLVAMGAAVLGGLLVLRGGPAPSAEAADDEYQAIRQPRRFAGRRSYQLERRLDIVFDRVHELDNRVAELSRRQTVLRVMARDGLGVVEQRLAELEGAIAETDARAGEEAERLHALLAQLAERILDVTAAAKRPQ
jgi:hypothetical protein